MNSLGLIRVPLIDEVQQSSLYVWRLVLSRDRWHCLVTNCGRSRRLLTCWALGGLRAFRNLLLKNLLKLHGWCLSKSIQFFGVRGHLRNAKLQLLLIIRVWSGDRRHVCHIDSRLRHSTLSLRVYLSKLGLGDITLLVDSSHLSIFRLVILS